MINGKRFLKLTNYAIKNFQTVNNVANTSILNYLLEVAAYGTPYKHCIWFPLDFDRFLLTLVTSTWLWQISSDCSDFHMTSIDTLWLQWFMYWLRLFPYALQWSFQNCRTFLTLYSHVHLIFSKKIINFQAVISE